MSKHERKIPLHYRDIVQKYFTEFIATENLYPLTSLNVKTKPIKRMLNSDISMIVDGKRVDCLMELEDNSLLHIEFQSSNDDQDIQRFWHYDFMILEGHKKKVGTNKYIYPKIRTIVIYTANIDPKSVTVHKDFGTHKYNFEARFLSEYTDNEALYGLLDKIKREPDLRLSAEDMVIVVYGTLAIQYIENVSEEVYNIAQIVNTLNDESTRATLLSAVYIIAKKFIDKETLKKLEGMLKMLNAFEEVEREIEEKGFQQGLEKGLEKGRLEEKLENAKNLIDVLSDEMIIKTIGITAEQLKKLKKEM
jgi:predicted transposase/invertase (TIGR01784 family)